MKCGLCLTYRLHFCLWCCQRLAWQRFCVSKTCRTGRNSTDADVPGYGCAATRRKRLCWISAFPSVLIYSLLLLLVSHFSATGLGASTRDKVGNTVYPSHPCIKFTPIQIQVSNLIKFYGACIFLTLLWQLWIKESLQSDIRSKPWFTHSENDAEVLTLMCFFTTPLCPPPRLDFLVSGKPQVTEVQIRYCNKLQFISCL